MKVRELLNKCRGSEWLLIPLVLAVLSFIGGAHYGERKALASLVTERDTVVRVVSVYKDFPQPAKTASLGYVSVPAYRFITDTVNTVETAEIIVSVHDTTVVYLPREQKYYSEADGRLRIWVSGYEPSLDRYEFDDVTTEINSHTISKPSRWGLSIHGGYGATLDGRTVRLTPYIGAGISYTFLRL